MNILPSYARFAVVWSSLAIWYSPVAIAAPQVMHVHYIDVGQANATLLEFPCGAVLIDCGAQDEDSVEYLAFYLETFFNRRTDLSDTLDALIITHPHIDHTRAIRRLPRVCRILNYVDGGNVLGSGRFDVQWIRDEVAANRLSVSIREVRDSEIVALPHKHGLSDDAIDPVVCSDCDPKIRILSGSHARNPGWSRAQFENLNNHSLVVRIDFGESSFLFTGDMQEPGLALMLDYYRGTDVLDADVYNVGHHGSHNATSQALLDAITPEIAVIGVGQWQYGKQGEAGGFNTYTYGHPRSDVVDLLASSIPGSRNQPKSVKVFTGQYAPKDYLVQRRIYATGWDGDVVVRADTNGDMRVDLRPTNWRPPVGEDALAAVGPVLPRVRMPTNIYDINLPAYDSVGDESLGTSPQISAVTITPCRPKCDTSRRRLFGPHRCFRWFRPRY